LSSNAQQEMKMQAWDVIRNGRVIDTVFYDRDCELSQLSTVFYQIPWYVRKGLIEHDGYPCDIIVRAAV